MRLLVPVVICCLALFPASHPAAAQDDERLERLFDELQTLDKRRDDRAGAIQARIWSIWYEHHDPRVREWMSDGLESLTRERYHDAVEVFTRVVQRAPEYAEAWNRRGTTYYLMGEYEHSLDDIARVLELEPRHFGALAGKGLCLRELGRPQAAIAAFQRALQINPHLDHVYIEILRLRARMAAKPPGTKGH